MASRFKSSAISRASINSIISRASKSSIISKASKNFSKSQPETVSNLPQTRVMSYTGFMLVYEIENGLMDLLRRWGVIRDLCLYLYKRRTDSACYKAIILPGASISYQRKRQKDKVIVIQEYNGDNLRFLPEDPKDFDDWYSILKAAASLEALQQQLNLKTNQEHGKVSSISTAIRNENSFDNSYPLDPSPTSVNGLRKSPDGRQFVKNKKITPSMSMPALEHKYTMPSHYNHQLPHLVNSDTYAQIAHPVLIEEVSYPLPNEHPSLPNDSSHFHPFNEGNKTIHSPFGSDREIIEALSSHPESYVVNRPNSFVMNSNIRKQSKLFQTMETLNENESLLDEELITTIPLAEVTRRYPVSGLAKRMSVVAGDLIGRSRDELILLLIQLNREKANLKRWKTYHQTCLEKYSKELVEMEEKQAEMNELDVTTMSAPIENLKECVKENRESLMDVEYQIELSLPLINFLDNIIKLGGIYGGDDLMFASEYRKSILSPGQFSPAKRNLHFLRSVQEREIAEDLTGKLKDANFIDSQTNPLPSSTEESVDEISQRIYENIHITPSRSVDEDGILLALQNRMKNGNPESRFAEAINSSHQDKYDSILIDVPLENVMQYQRTKEQLEMELKSLEDILIHKLYEKESKGLKEFMNEVTANGLKPLDLKAKAILNSAPSSNLAWLKGSPSEWNHGSVYHKQSHNSTSSDVSADIFNIAPSPRTIEDLNTFANIKRNPSTPEKAKDSAKFPRRSTRRDRKSDVSHSVRRVRQRNLSGELDAEQLRFTANVTPRPIPNQFVRKWSLPAAKAAELRWSKRLLPTNDTNVSDNNVVDPDTHLDSRGSHPGSLDLGNMGIDLPVPLEYQFDYSPTGPSSSHLHVFQEIHSAHERKAPSPRISSSPRNPLQDSPTSFDQPSHNQYTNQVLRPYQV